MRFPVYISGRYMIPPTSPMTYCNRSLRTSTHTISAMLRYMHPFFRLSIPHISWKNMYPIIRDVWQLRWWIGWISGCTLIFSLSLFSLALAFRPFASVHNFRQLFDVFRFQWVRFWLLMSKYLALCCFNPRCHWFMPPLVAKITSRMRISV